MFLNETQLEIGLFIVGLILVWLNSSWHILSLNAIGIRMRNYTPVKLIYNRIHTHTNDQKINKIWHSYWYFKTYLYSKCLTCWQLCRFLPIKSCCNETHMSKMFLGDFHSNTVLQKKKWFFCLNWNKLNSFHVQIWLIQLYSYH